MGVGAGGGDVTAAKAALRRALLLARRARPPEDRRRDAERLREAALAVPEVQAAGTVAAYAALPDEPGTQGLLATLRAGGVRVLLPVLLPDGNLDWAEYAGADGLRAGLRSTLEPAGPRLGAEAIATADVVLVPGLAVDPAGRRLGRGGGSYDRALARVPPDRLTAVVLFDGEVLPSVPAEAHDQRVRAVLTPSGLRRL